MLERTWNAICSQGLFDEGDRVILAVSGGADSMAMMYIIHGLRERLDLSLHVAHLNHMMRGEEAEADALFVQEAAKELGIPCTVGAADVPALIAKEKLSPEEAARKVRYDFLRRVALELRADKIAVAHHGDDQAETVIMHLLKGTGSEGLGGMQAKSGCIVRPLLGFRRAEIEQFCLENGIRFRNDTSNQDLSYSRNKIRYKLLPVLEEYNPCIVEALMRTAEIVQAENEYLRKETFLAFEKTVKSAQNELSVDCPAFVDLDKALQRRLAREIFRTLCGENAGLEFAHVERLREFIISGQTGKRIELPGNIVAEKNYNEVCFRERGAEDVEKRSWEPRPLVVPGITTIEELNLQITAEVLPADLVRGVVYSAPPEEAYMDWLELEPPLVAAPRNPGSVFHPFGSPGRKSLKQFFIDSKIPVKEREEIPIVSDRKGIVWVAGLRTDDRVKVTGSTRKILRLRIGETGNTG